MPHRQSTTQTCMSFRDIGHCTSPRHSSPFCWPPAFADLSMGMAYFARRLLRSINLSIGSGFELGSRQHATTRVASDRLLASVSRFELLAFLAHWSCSCCPDNRHFAHRRLMPKGGAKCVVTSSPSRKHGRHQRSSTGDNTSLKCTSFHVGIAVAQALEPSYGHMRQWWLLGWTPLARRGGAPSAACALRAS